MIVTYFVFKYLTCFSSRFQDISDMQLLGALDVTGWCLEKLHFMEVPALFYWHTVISLVNITMCFSFLRLTSHWWSPAYFSTCKCYTIKSIYNLKRPKALKPIACSAFITTHIIKWHTCIQYRCHDHMKNWLPEIAKIKLKKIMWAKGYTCSYMELRTALMYYNF